ncbi:hypothetical protein BHE74_00039357 [Ensete ventricosum]|nr:hypothetical protein GW17_00041941 [Ensete ventricosum]RWW54098.1 hypothetical protein BHE74_00039357 [Ensete ventricosum]RZS13287.1 hypothetical protein BHM03_00044848 [Ensete ventricosum]
MHCHHTPSPCTTTVCRYALAHCTVCRYALARPPPSSIVPSSFSSTSSLKYRCISMYRVSKPRSAKPYRTNVPSSAQYAYGQQGPFLQ